VQLWLREVRMSTIHCDNPYSLRIAIFKNTAKDMLNLTTCFGNALALHNITQLHIIHKRLRIATKTKFKEFKAGHSTTHVVQSSTARTQCQIMFHFHAAIRKFTFLLDIKRQDSYFKNHETKHMLCGPSADSSNVKNVGHIVTAVLSESNTAIIS